MTIDVDSLIAKCYRRQLLSERELRLVCESAKDVLLREGNVRSVRAPVTVVGDVHGLVWTRGVRGEGKRKGRGEES